MSSCRSLQLCPETSHPIADNVLNPLKAITETDAIRWVGVSTDPKLELARQADFYFADVMDERLELKLGVLRKNIVVILHSINARAAAGQSLIQLQSAPI